MPKNTFTRCTFLILITSLFIVGCQPKDKILEAPFWFSKKIADNKDEYHVNIFVNLHWENDNLYTKITIGKNKWYKDKTCVQWDSTDFKIVKSNFYNTVSIKLISDKGYTIEKYNAYIPDFKERDDKSSVAEYIFDKRPMQKDEYNSISKVEELGQ